MTVLRPRNRLVIFRLSDQEFETLKAACSQKEARSISDFARAAVLRSAGDTEEPEESLQERLSSMGRRLSDLESGMKRIVRLLEAMNGRNTAGL